MDNAFQFPDLKQMIDVLFADDHQLEFRMKGYSMFPLLRPGDTGIVHKCRFNELKKGDIVVFHQNNTLIAHRILGLNGEYILAKGDQSAIFDAPVPPQSIIGKLTHYSRSGKTFSTADSKAQLSSFLARYFTRPFTRYNQLLYRLFAAISSISRYTSDFRSDFRLAVAGVRLLFAVNTVIAIFQGILPFVVILLVKWLVDLLSTLPGQTTMPPEFVMILSLTGFSFLLSSVLSEVKSLYGEKLSQGVARSMYAHLHSTHISLELSHYENPKELDKMHRAVQEASFRPVKLLNEVQHLLKSLAASLFLLGIFISIRWYLVLVLLVAIAPGVLLKIRFARRYHQLKEKQSPQERKMYYFNRVLTGHSFAKEMKLFGFARYFLKRFRGFQDILFKDRLTLRRSEVMQNLLAQTFAVVLVFATLALVAFQSLSGLFTIGTVVLFFFAFQRGYSVLNDLFRSMAGLLEDTIFMNDFREFVERTAGEQAITANKPGEQTITANKPAEVPAFSLQQAIRIENLSFRYVNSKRDALQSVNLTIRKGETVAIVGANGSGKTTLIKLLCGFYQPDSGKIYYDNNTTSELGREVICKNLSAVFQDFALYNVSANENIALGDIDHLFSEFKVENAAKMAGIAEVLQQLPDGYKTLLGNQFLGGEELSLGQWQKLAIARAFYRDRELLLMDEPSSALDAVSEQQIIETLKKLAHQKTAVIISHRLSTVRWADRIVVFDQGRVVEEGTHDELILRKGTYAHLYQQATRSFED